MNPATTLSETGSGTRTMHAKATRPALVSVVVPCLNESDSLPQLAEKVLSLQESDADGHRYELVFVDDGSSDDTVALIHQLLDGKIPLRVEQHPVNRGIAAALMTGIRACGGDILVTIDADCTFDPLDIPLLLAELKEGVSVVIGSPYHPEGGVDHVPAWRIMLSRVCSRCYRMLFRNRANCYTGCFRAFRGDHVRDYELENSGFVGVVELLWKLDGEEGRFVEVPVRLSNRKYGKSKMKTLRAMFLHFVLMLRIATGLIRRPASLRPRTSAAG